MNILKIKLISYMNSVIYSDNSSLLPLFPPVITIVCFLTLVVFIANNMIPDQNSPIEVHLYKFSVVHMNIYSRHNKQTTFLRQNLFARTRIKRPTPLTSIKRTKPNNIYSKPNILNKALTRLGFFLVPVVLTSFSHSLKKRKQLLWYSKTCVKLTFIIRQNKEFLKRQVVAKWRSKVLQNAPLRAFCNTFGLNFILFV